MSELAWILSCVAEKGLLNRSHAYKAATDSNKENGKKDVEEGISADIPSSTSFFPFSLFESVAAL